MTSAMNTQNKGFPYRWILYLLAAIGTVLIVKRFIYGIGAVSNLNDAYPWGFWIGIDVLAGIALAAGGFTLTAAIYIWGNEKYHPLARPAILTALLGYVIFVIALVIDLGRGILIWHFFLPWMWQHDSVMFEVGWCVMIYLTILVFEFLPSALERFNWKTLLRLWEMFTPVVVVVLLSLFTYVMTYSKTWTTTVFIMAVVFELLQSIRVIPRSRPVPVLLIMAGVILSCLHQSSLGSLYLIVPHKLDVLWYSPILPVQFLISAIMVGPAMVIFEGLVSARVFRRQPELDLLAGLAKVLPFLIASNLLLRVADLVGRGAVVAAFELNLKSVMFWMELMIGGVIPIALFGVPEIARTAKGMFWGALLVVVGLFLNRFNVAVVGIEARGWETYTPALTEILISAGIVSIGLLAFRFIVRNFPIYEKPLVLAGK